MILLLNLKTLSTKLNCGFLYVAAGKRYLLEAETSARSLKRFTQFPICLITNDDTYKNTLFDCIIIQKTGGDFIVKILGVQKTPFDKTIFLDTDTFVCASIDHLFPVLDIFDMSMMVDNFVHGYSFLKKYNPSFKLQYETAIPEYNSGVIVYKNNSTVRKLFNDWLTIHEEMHVKADMPSLREAVLANAATVRISPLPFEYNFHGIHTFGFAYTEIKVIHERLGERWNTLTTRMLSFEKMEKIAKRINKFKSKRIILPYIGVVPYTYSPYRIKYKIKKFFGIKKQKKQRHFNVWYSRHLFF